MPRLLLVTYEFPPKGGPGVQRPLKTARYLAEAGWDVTVLTVADPPGSMWDPGPLSELPHSVNVERAWSLEPTRLVQSLRRHFASRNDSRSSHGAPSASRGISGLPRWAIRAIQALFIPDEKFWWTPWAVRLGRRLHADCPFDCILASGPPFTALGIARRLSHRLAIPWVADLRDPIVGGYFFTPLTPLHAVLMRAYERRVVHSASRVITATEAMQRDLAARNPDVHGRLVTISNGFDPADFSTTAPLPLVGFTISYVGSLQGEINVERLLAAVARARGSNPGFAADVRVRLVGPIDPETTRAVEQSGMAAIVERAGFLGHADALSEMRASTILALVLGSGPQYQYILTGKLPEYLASGRPVLALVPEGVAADVVRRAGAGWVVHPTDIEAATQALLDAYACWKRNTLPVADASVVDEFDRRQLVSRVGDLLEEVIAGVD